MKNKICFSANLYYIISLSGKKLKYVGFYHTILGVQYTGKYFLKFKSKLLHPILRTLLLNHLNKLYYGK